MTDVKVLPKPCSAQTCEVNWSPRKRAVRRLRAHSALRNLLHVASFSVPFLTTFVTAYAFFCAHNHVERIVELAPLTECVLLGLCAAFTCLGLAMVSTPDYLRRKSHSDMRCALRKIAPELTSNKR